MIKDAPLVVRLTAQTRDEARRLLASGAFDAGGAVVVVTYEPDPEPRKTLWQHLKENAP